MIFLLLTWKAALRADFRSFLAAEPNTPPSEDDGTDDESEVENCKPPPSIAWAFWSKKRLLDFAAKHVKPNGLQN